MTVSLRVGQQETDEQIRARCVFISQLQQHIEKCEREENYVEAQRCKQRYEELCIQDRRARIARLKDRHKQEFEQLEEIMAVEKAARVDSWNQKIEQLNVQIQKNNHSAFEKLNEERQKKKQMIEQKLEGQFPRPSVKLCELRKAQNQLVRLGEYQKAEEYRIKADALEQIEIKRKDAENQDSFIKQLEQIIEKEKTAKETLNKRHQFQTKQLAQTMNKDLEILDKKQNNIRKQLQQAQNQELARLIKAPKGLPFMVDSDGNDLLTTSHGLQEISQIMMEQKPQLEVKSLARAYMDGILTVKPGDTYYSPNDQFAVEQMGYGDQLQLNRDDGDDMEV